MTITETVLVFVGIPAAVVAVVYGLVFAGSAARGKRYRPGRPFNSTAVWFVANKSGATAASSSAHEIGAGSASQALSGGTETEGAPGEHDEGAGLATVRYGETGGASDSW